MSNYTYPKGTLLSCIALSDDGTWEQATYRLPVAMADHEFRCTVCYVTGGFLAVGVQEDFDCDEEFVRDLPFGS